MRVLLALGLLAWSGCTCTLPESVPMIVRLRLEGAPTGLYPAQTRALNERFVGAEVMRDGKVVTRLEVKDLLIQGTFTATRAEAVGAQKVPYTLRVKGTCGTQEIPLTAPPPLWQAMDEKDLARALEQAHVLPLFLGAPAGSLLTVFVDAGEAPEGTLMLGETELAPGPAGVETGRALSLGGCTLPLEVKLDGETIGKIEGKEPAVLISTKTELCHEMGAVLCGNEAQPPFSRFVTRGRGVFALPQSPSHFLVRAPATVQSGNKGTWVSQLLRVNCE